MTTYTEEQFNRLPKWAQYVIKQADARMAEAGRMIQQYGRAEAALRADVVMTALDGVEDSSWRGGTVAYRDWYDDRIPVARQRDEITFVLDETRLRETVAVSVRNGALEVRGDRYMILEPQAGNTVLVRLSER